MLTQPSTRSSQVTEVMLLASLVCALVAAPARAAELSLEDALRMARANQPQLLLARAQARQARARSGQALAAYLPRVDLQAQYQRSTPNFLLSPIMLHTPLAKAYQAENDLGVGDTVNYYIFGVSASQLLFDFGKTPGLVAQAEALERASEADESAADLTTATNVRVAYYAALAAQELAVVADEAVANQQKHLEQVRRFVAAGQRTRFDLSSIELSVSSSRLTQARSRDLARLAGIKLNTAIGVEASTAFELRSPRAVAPDAELLPAEQLVAEARQHRPELARAEAQVEAARASERVARAAYLPSISAIGGASGARVASFGAGYDWFVGVGLNWNLFGGFATTHQLAETQAGQDAAAAARSSAELTILADVEEQKLAILDAQARCELAEAAVATATDRLEQAEHRFETGAGDALDLDDAQVALSTAKAQAIQASFDLATGRARLTRALGRG